MALQWWEVLLRLVVAMLLGALVGWERETRGKPAGLRTLSLVSLASAIFVVAAQEASTSLGVPVEPVRAMIGIAQGVGFLGAGAIVQARREVRWLTTAAALWAVAAIGYACGVGLYFVAVTGGILIFVLLRWVALVERRWIGPVTDADSSSSARRKDG